MTVFSKKYISAINISLLIFYVALAIVLPFLHTCSTDNIDESGNIQTVATYSHDAPDSDLDSVSISGADLSVSNHDICAVCLLARNNVSIVQATDDIFNHKIQISLVVFSEISAKYQHLILLSSRAPPVS